MQELFTSFQIPQWTSSEVSISSHIPHSPARLKYILTIRHTFPLYFPPTIPIESNVYFVIQNKKIGASRQHGRVV